EPVLLLHRKLQCASNFLISYWFLLFVLNIADGFGRCADYRRHGEIARFLAHRECLKLVWSFSEASDFLCHKFFKKFDGSTSPLVPFSLKSRLRSIPGPSHHAHLWLTRPSS